jgi:hypothetical protein
MDIIFPTFDILDINKCILCDYVHHRAVAFQSYKSTKAAQAMKQNGLTHAFSDIFSVRYMTEMENIKERALPCEKDGLWVAYPFALWSGPHERACVIYKNGKFRNVRLYRSIALAEDDNKRIALAIAS